MHPFYPPLVELFNLDKTIQNKQNATPKAIQNPGTKLRTKFTEKNISSATIFVGKVIRFLYVQTTKNIVFVQFFSLTKDDAKILCVHFTVSSFFYNWLLFSHILFN